MGLSSPTHPVTASQGASPTHDLKGFVELGPGGGCLGRGPCRTDPFPAHLPLRFLRRQFLALPRRCCDQAARAPGSVSPEGASAPTQAPPPLRAGGLPSSQDRPTVLCSPTPRSQPLASSLFLHQKRMFWMTLKAAAPLCGAVAHSLQAPPEVRPLARPCRSWGL